jgi:Restriction endonuclease
MSDKSGTQYECLTQVVFQWIVNQSELRNVEVRHDVTLAGKHQNSHQIDVYWKFAVGDLEYETIVEVKDWNKPVDQGELIHFKGVLEDLLGQPKGIFVSRSGYQQGAKDFARSHGILIYELREADYPPPVAFPSTGWARYHVIFMPVHGVLHEMEESAPADTGVLGIIWDIFTPEYSNIQFEPSMSWLQQEYPAVDFAKLGTAHLPSTFLHKIEFYDEEKTSIGNLVAVFREIAQAMDNEGLTTKLVRHVFQPPILIRTDSLPVPYVRMDAVSMDVTLEHRQEVRRTRKTNFAEWVLREVTSGQTEWFLATQSVRAFLPSKTDLESS